MANAQTADNPVKTILRIRFGRTGAAVWLAHLDLMRTFERSVRRAAIPVRWSAGFNPRPDLVFALPIGVGLETCADTVDIGLEDGEIDADQLVDRLNRHFPVGLSAIAGVIIPDSHDSIMSRIAAADYVMEASQVTRAAGEAMQLRELVIDKPSKGKTLRVDIKPLVLMLEADGPDRIRIRVKAGSRENLRPDLFLAALTQYGHLDPAAAADARLIRTGLYLTGGVPDQPLTDPQGKPMPSSPASCFQESLRTTWKTT